MKKRYDRINVKPDVAKTLGLKNSACGIILEAVSDETFAIKAFESPKRVTKKKKFTKPTKKDIEKVMSDVNPNIHLMHLQRGIIHLLLNNMDIIYEAADKSVVEHFKEIEEMLSDTPDDRVKKKKKNILYVNFDKETIH